MTTGLGRSATERAALHAAAREREGWSQVMGARCRPVAATLEWLDGTRPTGPVTGEASLAGAPPGPDAIHAELQAANDLEREQRYDGEDSTWAGMVAHTLSWARGHADAESPLP